MVYTYPTNITSIVGLLHYENNLVGGILGLIMLIVIFLISFVAMKNNMSDFKGTNVRVLAASAFVTTFFSVMFSILGLTNSTVMYVCIIITAIAGFASLQSSGD